ncbi:MAG: YkvA family protein [Bacillota bacterium]
MQRDHKHFYLILRGRLHAWIAKCTRGSRLSDLVLAIPDLFYLMCRMLGDPRVSASDKLRFAGGISYFMWPADLMPDVMFPFGFLDDMVICATILDKFISHAPKEVVLENWPGSQDVLGLIRQLLGLAQFVSRIQRSGRMRRRSKVAPAR